MAAPQDVGDLQIVDPDGDVILKIGAEYRPATNLQQEPNPMRILASSQILMSSSPFFAAMLGGRFAEAQIPFTKESPPTINLPEDDPEVMMLYCKCIHHGCPDTECSSWSDNILLPGLVKLCDKYDCLGSIHPWLDPKMDPATKKSTTYLEPSSDKKWSFAGSAFLAYLVDDSELFRVATASMLYYSAPTEIAIAFNCLFADKRAGEVRTKLTGERSSSSYDSHANFMLQ